jgi:hypothetical protein
MTFIKQNSNIISQMCMNRNVCNGKGKCPTLLILQWLVTLSVKATTYCNYNEVKVWKPIGRRIRGRPRKRWIEDEEDFQAMGIRGWRKLSKERTEWKKITEKAKTHNGL